MSTFTGMPVENSLHWKIGRETKQSLTPSQKGFIFANHAEMTIIQMATHLGKKYETIARFVKKYNLTTQTKHYGRHNV